MNLPLRVFHLSIFPCKCESPRSQTFQWDKSPAIKSIFSGAFNLFVSGGAAPDRQLYRFSVEEKKKKGGRGRMMEEDALKLAYIGNTSLRQSWKKCFNPKLTEANKIKSSRNERTTLQLNLESTVTSALKQTVALQ